MPPPASPAAAVLPGGAPEAVAAPWPPSAGAGTGHAHAVGHSSSPDGASWAATSRLLLDDRAIIVIARKINDCVALRRRNTCMLLAVSVLVLSRDVISLYKCRVFI